MSHEAFPILLVGPDTALLEGLAQSVGTLGYPPLVAHSIREAAEAAALRPPLVLVVERALAAESSAATLAILLAPGGALVVYHSMERQPPVVVPMLQRAVLADLALPLERQRLIALVHHVAQRVMATGRRKDSPPERAAF
jgi:DNA-binding NtrC family response regulator